MKLPRAGSRAAAYDEGVTEYALPPKHPWHVGRLVVAWGVATVIGVLVAIFVHDAARFQWLAFAVGASTLVTFALQLSTARREGFITRTSFSVAGSVLIIGAIDLFCVLLLD